MAKPHGKKHRQQQTDLKYKYRINEEIRAPQVRLVGDNVTPGIYPTREALEMARKMELDLVEVAPNADPPVCRIMDFTKFIFEKQKKEKEQKKKTHQIEVKEIRFTPLTSEHDIEFKLRYARAFLEEGNKVKAYVFFRGRQLQILEDKARQVLNTVIEKLADIGKMEKPPTLEGNRLSVIIAPARTKKQS